MHCLPACAAVAALCLAPHAHAAGFATCRGQPVSPQAMCSVGPLTFSGQCETAQAGYPPAWGPELAIAVADPESNPILVSEVHVATQASNTSSLAIFSGDSDDPDPITGQEWGMPQGIPNTLYAHVQHQFPAGTGMQLYPGTVLQHHIDVHVACDPGGDYVGSITLWYYPVQD